jgi:hypothetical protein
MQAKNKNIEKPGKSMRENKREKKEDAEICFYKNL